MYWSICWLDWFLIFGVLTPLSAIFQLYHGDQLLAHGRWFSPSTPASPTTKAGRHDIAEILLKVALKHQKSKFNQVNKYFDTYELMNFIECKINLYTLCNVLFLMLQHSLLWYECWNLQQQKSKKTQTKTARRVLMEFTRAQTHRTAHRVLMS